MSEHDVIALIRRLGQRQDGLFRAHRTHPALHARARRFFGSWASAVVAAGLDYHLAIHRARQHSIRARRQLGPARHRSARPPL